MFGEMKKAMQARNWVKQEIIDTGVRMWEMFPEREVEVGELFEIALMHAETWNKNGEPVVAEMFTEAAEKFPSVTWLDIGQQIAKKLGKDGVLVNGEMMFFKGRDPADKPVKPGDIEPLPKGDENGWAIFWAISIIAGMFVLSM